MLLKSVGDLSQRPYEIVNIPSLSVKKRISSILIYDNIRLMNKINSKYINSLNWKTRTQIAVDKNTFFVQKEKKHLIRPHAAICKINPVLKHRSIVCG